MILSDFDFQSLGLLYLSTRQGFYGQSNPHKVLVVGEGPVGLTLAIDLAQRGIAVAFAEIRAGGELPGVRCNHVAARTMEIFRRLGLVQAVRNAGLPRII